MSNASAKLGTTAWEAARMLAALTKGGAGKVASLTSVTVGSIVAAALLFSAFCTALASEDRAAAADLAVTIHATQGLQRMELLTDTVTVTNNGPSDADSVRLFIWIAGIDTFGSAQSSQGSCTVDDRRLNCDLGVLASGDVATVTILITPTAARPITSTAWVVCSEPDPDTSNNRASDETVVRGLPNDPPHRSPLPRPAGTPV